MIQFKFQLFIIILSYYNYFLMNLSFYRLYIVLFLIIMIEFSSSQSIYPSFDEWARSYGKIYKTDQQREFRRAVFDKNVQKVINNNNNPNSTFRIGLNSFSDRLDEQMQVYRGLKVLPPKDRKNSAEIKLLSSNLRTAPTLDHRQSGIITEPKNQKSCGSCWAFTAVSLFESFLIKQGRQNKTIDLSEQFLIQCQPNNNGCYGGTIERGVDRGNKSCPLESEFKYTNGFSYYGAEKICKAKGIPTDIKRLSFYELDDDQLVRLIARGPVGVAVNSQNWKDYKSGIITCTKKQVDHAVVAVGYTQNSIIVKNSWGKGWGEGGYVHVSRNPQNNCGITNQAHLLIKSEWQIFNMLSISIMVCILLILAM